MCVCTLWNSNDENSHSTGVKIGEYILPWNLTSKGGKKWWRWWYFVNVEASRGSCWYPWREASLPWRLMQSTSHSDRCRLPDQTLFFFVHICHKFSCSRVCGLGVSMVHSILKHCVRMCPWMGGSRAWKDPRQKPAVEATPTGDIFPAFHLPGLAALYLHLVQVQNYFHYDRSVSETMVTVKSLALTFWIKKFSGLSIYYSPGKKV